VIELEKKVDTLRETLDDFIRNVGIEFNKAYNLITQNQISFEAFQQEMREFKAEMKDFKDESQRQIKEMNKKWGELSNKMGTLVEDIIFPGLPRVIKDTYGLETVDLSIRRKKTLPGGRNREFDAIAVAGEYVFVNSTKGTMRKNYIDDFIVEMGEFREFFPEYKEHKLVGLLASLYVDPGLTAYGERCGFYVLGLGDSPIAVLNAPGFRAKEW